MKLLRHLLPLLALVLLPSLARAQGNSFSGTVQNTQGQAIGGATITVCNYSDTLSGGNCPAADASIYSNPTLTSALSNPTYSDGNGNYVFFVATGYYYVTISGNGIATQTYPFGSANSGGGGSPGGTGTQIQYRLGSTLFGGASGSSVDLAGDITVGANLSIAGPAPWIDVTAGGHWFASTSTADFSCSSGSNQVTLSGGAGDFAVGNTVQISGCGTPTLSSAPSSLTGTPVGGTASTHYTYYVSGVSALQSDTPYTAVTLTTGVATLTIAQYNQVCWADDSTVVGHDIWVGSTAGAATFVGYTGDDCWNDYGYKHDGERASAAPTHPPSSATASILEATINAIGSPLWTLSANAGVSNASAIMVHDGNPEIKAAIALIGTEGIGGTIFFPISTTSNTYEIAGGINLDADSVKIVVQGNPYIQTANSVPAFQISEDAQQNFYVDGGYWPEKLYSITPDGVSRWATTNDVHFSGCCGGVGIYGQSYNWSMDTFYTSTVYHTFDFGYNTAISGTSFVSNWQANNGWSQGDQCSVIFSSSPQAHVWNLSNWVFENEGTQTCAQEGVYLTFAGNSNTAGVDGMQWDNITSSDVSGATAQPLILLQYAAIGLGFTCNQCNLGNGNGDIFKTTNLGGGVGAGLWGPASFNGGTLEPSSGAYAFNGAACSVTLNGVTLANNLSTAQPGGCIGALILQNPNGTPIQLPSIPSYAPTAAGAFGYDSTNTRLGYGTGSGTAYTTWYTAAPLTGQCPQATGTFGQFTWITCGSGSVTPYSVYASGSSSALWVTPTGNLQCFMSAPSGYSTTTPFFQACPSGFTNPMTTLGDFIYGAGSGVATRIAGPTTPNGIAQTLTETPSSSLAVAPSWSIPGVAIDAQTGTSYSIPITDDVSFLTGSNSGATAWTGFALANHYVFSFMNLGAGLITYTPASGPVNGNATQIIPHNWFGFHYTDNTNTYMPVLPSIAAFPNCLTSLNFTSATGAFSCNASPTFVAPVLGTATATSLLASGIVDGKAPVTITTGSSATLGGTYKSGYTFNAEATAATAVTYTLPTAAAGLQYCVSNINNGSAATTGTLSISTSASGQYIDDNGTLSASGGYIISGGAAGDSGCVVGESSTVWKFYTQSPPGGTWSLH